MTIFVTPMSGTEEGRCG